MRLQSLRIFAQLEMGERFLVPRRRELWIETQRVVVGDHGFPVFAHAHEFASQIREELRHYTHLGIIGLRDHIYIPVVFHLWEYLEIPELLRIVFAGQRHEAVIGMRIETESLAIDPIYRKCRVSLDGEYFVPKAKFLQESVRYLRPRETYHLSRREDMGRASACEFSEKILGRVFVYFPDDCREGLILSLDKIGHTSARARLVESMFQRIYLDSIP